ncbi:MAG: PAS domain S-box protein, partial [Anaerolineales bacterium]|nr:PAS domain S-box protein [Anaerolineales bacterium]
SQALYRNVTEQAEDGIAIVKGDLIVYTNPRLLAMTGYLPGDILYREFSYFIPPEHVQPLVDGFSRRVGGDSQPFLFETQLSRKDGVSLPVEVKLGLMSFEGEEAALVLIQDITLRKEAESQMRLQSAALRSAANGFVITDWEGRIQWVNAALEAMTGYSFEEVVGKNPRIFKSGKQDRAFYEQLWSTILAGRVWQGELVNRKKGGDFYDEHLTIAPVMDNNGQITHFVAVKEDISERKQNEKALRRSERQFRELVWNTPISMMIFGYDHRLLYVNLRFSELFGYQAQDIPTFDHWWELAFVSEGHREQIRQEWRAHFHSDVQDSSGFIPIEAEVICKNGRHRFVRFSLVLLEDKYIVALTDLTKQKRAEQHLQQRARNLSLLNEITLSALRTNDLDGLCQELADQLMAFFEAEACFITLWDEINRLPVPMAASGPLRDTYRTMAHPASGEPTLTETVLQAGRVIFVEDVLHSPHANPLIAAEFQSRSILALPLIADNRRLGAAIISYNQHHFFTEEDVERGERAAAQVALGLAKVRLFEAEREKHQLSLALVEISTLLSASLSVSTLLTRILDLLQRVVPYDAGNIFGIENGISRVLYTRGYEQFGEELDKYVQTVELEIAKTPNLRRMVETQLPLIISNTADAPDWVTLKTHALFRSWAGAPIHYNGKVMAIISLEKQEPDFFQPEHAGRLAAFAGQAAIALENARLFEEVRQLATVDALTGAYTRRHILDLALQEIQRSRRYGNPFCVIMFDIARFGGRSQPGCLTIPAIPGGTPDIYLVHNVGSRSPR